MIMVKSMNIKFAKKFVKQYSKAPLKIQKAFDKRLKIFVDSPYHSLLNNHSLVGEYSRYRSINITGDWRAIYLESEERNKVKVAIFVVLGTHSRLYK